MSDTNVQLVLNSRDRTSGTYNSSLYNAKGQNIIQGNIKQITVSEVNFPYDIPNIQAGFNTFELLAFTFPILSSPHSILTASVPGNLIITVPPGFYTGAELETAINGQIGLQQVAVSAVVDDAPTVSYDATTNLFTFIKPVNAPPGNPTPDWGIWSAYTFPLGYQGNTNDLGKDILSIMGFLNSDAGPGTTTLNIVSSDPAHPANATFQAGSSAPLIFTQYIDICSSQLCKNQYMSDGSTTNLARRSDVICRLFVCDNVSLATQEVDGTRPFIINRQYYNARMMKWTVGAAIGTVDINLYDDIGQPLLTTWAPRPFQITFNCHENPRDEGGLSGDTVTNTLKYFAPYTDKNTQAWDNLGSVEGKQPTFGRFK